MAVTLCNGMGWKTGAGGKFQLSDFNQIPDPEVEETFATKEEIMAMFPIKKAIN